MQPAKDRTCEAQYVEQWVNKEGESTIVDSTPTPLDPKIEGSCGHDSKVQGDHIGTRAPDQSQYPK